MKEQVYKSGQLRLHLRDNARQHFLSISTKRIKFFLIELEKFIQQQNFLLKDYQQIEISLTLCGPNLIRRYNRQYRNKDKVTDVLSFPIYDNLRSIKELMPPYIELGDIFICREVAIQQAKQYELSIEQEVMRQLIHGTLHLLGFDHEISLKEEQIMFKYEQQLYELIYRD